MPTRSVSFLNLSLLPLVAALALAAAPLAQAQTSTPARAPSAPVVQLPDFTALVEQTTPSVVNIEATVGGSSRSAEAPVAAVAPGPSAFRGRLPAHERRFIRPVTGSAR